jgi:cytochrome c oxidase subunit IV
MAAAIVSVRTYVAVLAALLLLTVLTVSVSFLHLGENWHITIGLLIAATKASLVILFFMHAIHSPRVTWCVILVCIVFLIIIFSLTLADVMTRSLLPFMPGH